MSYPLFNFNIQWNGESVDETNRTGCIYIYGHGWRVINRNIYTTNINIIGLSIVTFYLTHSLHFSVVKNHGKGLDW